MKLIAFLATALVTGPILPSLGSKKTDFGPGSYTTTIERQARKWAAEIAFSMNIAPAVVEIVIPRTELAGLQSLVFVRGDDFDDDFWSFIHHCRAGPADHGRTQPNASYDVVYGPVTAYWNQRMIIGGGDQISFHTSAAEKIWNTRSQRRII